MAHALPQTFCTGQRLQRGARVVVRYLARRPEFNGQEGTVLDFIAEEGRWRVVLADGRGLRLKPENLEPRRGKDGVGRPLQVRVTGLPGNGPLEGRVGLLCEQRSEDRLWRVSFETGENTHLPAANIQLLPPNESEGVGVQQEATGVGDPVEQHARIPLPPTQPLGSRVRITGLSARPDLDTQLATLVEYIVCEERWKVRLCCSGQIKYIRGGHLQLLRDSSDSQATSHSQADGLQQLRPDLCVTVAGLQNRPELNGLAGRLLKHVEGEDRWQVALDDGSCKLLRPANLKPLGSVSVQAKAEDSGPAGEPAPAPASQSSASTQAHRSVPDLRERFQRFLATGERLCIPDTSFRGKSTAASVAAAPTKLAQEAGRAEVAGVPAPSSSRGTACSSTCAADGAGRDDRPVTVVSSGSEEKVSTSRPGPGRSPMNAYEGTASVQGKASKPVEEASAASSSHLPGESRSHRIRVKGVLSRPELNGQLGRLLEPDTAGRWRVVTDRGVGLSLRPLNIEGVHPAAVLPWGENMPNAATTGASVPGLEQGNQVQLTGLTVSPELNGLCGELVDYDAISGRWRIRLENGSGCSVRPWHLKAHPATVKACTKADAAGEVWELV